MANEMKGTNIADDEEAMTCDALCSLSAGDAKLPAAAAAAGKAKTKASHNSPRQFQLPMFLSKSYHMIEKCDSDIACWAEGGDSFVIKNLEKFASDVLPRYFKHSNFSSFARQLNFYGFRKLRTEPILTNEDEAESSAYVRFYHANFQKDKPELMQNIKRATKGGEQHSKDDVDVLRQEVASLRQKLASQATDYDRKLAELSYECNRRISSMNAEYDKLAAMVHNSFRGGGNSAPTGHVMILPMTSAPMNNATQAQPLQMHMATGDLLQSLSQAAAASLHQEQASVAMRQDLDEGNNNRKRAANSLEININNEGPAVNRPRNV